MTLLATGYFDWAPIYRTPAFDALITAGGKLISTRRTPVEFLVIHSLEGRVSVRNEIRELISRWPNLPETDRARVLEVLGRAHFEFKNPRRPAVAWHGTILQRTKFGLIQHAPIWAHLAHGHAANPRGPGYENEGLAPEPFDTFQCETWERMTADCEAFFGRRYRRELMSLREHREFGPTACPSERPAPLYAREMEEEMTPDEKARLERVERLLAGRGRVPVVVSADNLMAVRRVRANAQIGQTVEFTGADTLAYLDYAENNFWLGLAQTQNRVRALELREDQRLDPGEVPDHRHEIDSMVLSTGGVIYETEDP